jgi:hypothetical protein
MRKTLSALALFAAVGLFRLPAFGQSRSTGTSTTTTTTPSGSSSSQTAPTSPYPSNVQVSDAAWFLNGHVLMEDGTVPADKVDIVSVCSGIRHTEAHTDKKGEFSFRLGRANPGVTPDASQQSTRSAPPSGTFNVDPSVAVSLSQNPLGDCAIHAEMVGFRSDVVLLAGRTVADSPNLGTIVLHPTANSPGGTVSAASLAAPKAAQKSYAKGVEAEKDKKNEEAAKYFSEAVHAYPQYAEAWYELGNVEANLHDASASRLAYDSAITADPTFTLPYWKIAQLDEQAKNWQSLADVTAKLIKLAPNSEPEVFLFNSVANYNLKNMPAAEESARAGVKVDTLHRTPKFWYILGVLMANRGDIAGALEQFKNYVQYAPDGPDATAVRNNIAALEKMTAPKQ